MKTKPLPHNWQKRKLEEVTYFQEGPGLRTFQFKPRGIRVINVANVQDGFLDLQNTKFLDELEVKSKYQHFLINENDILLSTSGTIGRAAIVRKSDIPLMLNTSVVRFHTREAKTLSNNFLYYFLSSSGFRNELLKYKTGVAIFNVGPSHLKRIKILLPPFPIQQAIVERLDAIRNTQELTNKQITLADELFQSLLAQELNPKGKNWEVKRLQEVISLNQSGIWGENARNNDSYPVIRSTEMTYEGELDLTSVVVRYIPKDKVSKYTLSDGDILIVKSSGSANLIGRGVLFIQPTDKRTYLFSNFIQRLRANNLILPKFLFYFLNSEGRRFLDRLQTTTSGLRNLPMSQYLNIKIPLPPLPIQQAIVEKLQSVQDYKSKLMEQKGKLQELFDSALSRAMNGELVK